MGHQNDKCGFRPGWLQIPTCGRSAVTIRLESRVPSIQGAPNLRDIASSPEHCYTAAAITDISSVHTLYPKAENVKSNSMEDGCELGRNQRHACKTLSNPNAEPLKLNLFLWTPAARPVLFAWTSRIFQMLLTAESGILMPFHIRLVVLHPRRDGKLSRWSRVLPTVHVRTGRRPINLCIMVLLLTPIQ